MGQMPSSIDPSAAFRALYERHRDEVWRYFRRRAGDDDADELTAEVFVVAWRSRDRPPDDARPWLYGVARNVLANHRRGVQRAAALGERVGREASAAVDDHADLAHVRADLAAALARLAPADREVLLLVAWEGLTSAEAAKVLGCRAPAARARLSRARRRLRAVLDPADPALPLTTPEPTP
jgi:RNA polymerase sigma-70 factor (ECF subfamily)